MTKQVKNIMTLDSASAMDFFMKSAQYHGFELPEYYVFDDILNFVRDRVGNARFEDCIQKGISPEGLSDVNLDILLNKDGKYAVRPIILANPYLYYFLVREVCNEKGWAIVQDLFTKFQVPHVFSSGLPIIPAKKESFHKSSTILNWWNSMEQRSLELSLEYRYMFVTDITNCYGSINPQAFEWAFGLKSTRFETNENTEIARNIQKLIRALQQGRNIGIPQGNAIFDFISEIILGYADLLLHEAIEEAEIKESYEILRYRDDYKIFCNDKGKLEQISYLLQQVLESLNFRMNSQKTKVSDSIITDSIKPDKLFYIYNTPIFNKEGVDFDGLQKHLLYILMFGRQYPNAGQLKTMLSHFDKRVIGLLKEANKTVRKQVETFEEKDWLQGIFKHAVIYGKVSGLIENVRAMSAICAQIALENVSASHYALRVLSRMVDSLDDEQEKSDIIAKVYEKLCHQPNSTYNQLWLQNITLKQDLANGNTPYTMRLCRVVAGDAAVELWNNDWLKPSFTKGFNCNSVVDQEKIKDITPVINFRENRAYDEDEICELDEQGYLTR